MHADSHACQGEALTATTLVRPLLYNKILQGTTFLLLGYSTGIYIYLATHIHTTYYRYRQTDICSGTVPYTLMLAYTHAVTVTYTQVFT